MKFSFDNCQKINIEKFTQNNPDIKMKILCCGDSHTKIFNY